MNKFHKIGVFIICLWSTHLLGQVAMDSIHLQSFENLEDGKIYACRDIKFTICKMELTEDSKAVLHTIGTLLVENESLKVEFRIHTDHRGTNESNLKLCEYRGRQIKAFLIANFNINPKRIMIHPLGENEPIIPLEEITNSQSKEEVEKLHQINRRVEVKIIKS